MLIYTLFHILNATLCYPLHYNQKYLIEIEITVFLHFYLLGHADYHLCCLGLQNKLFSDLVTATTLESHGPVHHAHPR